MAKKKKLRHSGARSVDSTVGDIQSSSRSSSTRKGKHSDSCSKHSELTQTTQSSKDMHQRSTDAKKVVKDNDQPHSSTGSNQGNSDTTSRLPPAVAAKIKQMEESTKHYKKKIKDAKLIPRMKEVSCVF